MRVVETNIWWDPGPMKIGCYSWTNDESERGAVDAPAFLQLCDNEDRMQLASCVELFGGTESVMVGNLDTKLDGCAAVFSVYYFDYKDDCVSVWIVAICWFKIHACCVQPLRQAWRHHQNSSSCRNVKSTVS